MMLSIYMMIIQIYIYILIYDVCLDGSESLWNMPRNAQGNPQARNVKRILPPQLGLGKDMRNQKT